MTEQHYFHRTRHIYVHRQDKNCEREQLVGGKVGETNKNGAGIGIEGYGR